MSSFDGHNTRESVADAPSRLAAMLDALPALVMTARADGSVATFNRQWTSYTGVEDADAHAQGWTASLHPDDDVRVREVWRSIVRSGEAGETEVRLRRQDGTHRWFMLRASPWRASPSAPLEWVILFFDVDERYRRGKVVGAGTHDVLARLDAIPSPIATMTPTGAVASVNRPLVEYIGRNLEELRDWALGDAIHPDDLPRVVSAWQHAVATESQYEIEHRIRHADGSYRWFHVRGKPERDEVGQVVRWYNVLSDIDARKRSEEELRRSEARLESANLALRASERELSLIVQTIPGLVWCASPDGEITYVNRRILELLGEAFEGILQGRWSTLVHPDERDATGQAWFHAVTTGSPFDVQFRLRRRDGAYQWFHSIAQLGRDDADVPTHWYGMLMDIEEQRRADDTMSDMRGRLMQAARVATVAELSASIAHEINQPLTAVVSNGQACNNWLSAQPPNVENARRAADRVVRDGRAAGEIVARLRALFKRGPLDRDSLSMNQLIQDVLDLIRPEAGRRRAVIQSDLDPHLPAVIGDRVQLQQLVLNLVQNALDAVDTTATRPRTVRLRSSRDAEGGVLVEVIDSGVGLPDPTKVFEAFFTTKDHGMGMGLAICRTIVEAHGGQIRAANGESQGARFSFTLPARPPEPS